MRSDEQFPQDDSKPSRPRFRWELYYYERVGTEYHLRITPFAIILIVVAMMIGYTILYFDGYRSQGNPDVNVTTLPTPTQSPMQNIIAPTPQPKTKTVRNK